MWTKEILGDDDSFGQEGSPTKVVEIWRPELKKEGKVATGSSEELVDMLYSELKHLGVA